MFNWLFHPYAYTIVKKQVVNTSRFTVKYKWCVKLHYRFLPNLMWDRTTTRNWFSQNFTNRYSSSEREEYIVEALKEWLENGPESVKEKILINK